MNQLNSSSPTRLSKVYFVWVIRDFGTAEWFHSLLHAIEEQDVQGRIDISIYLTAKLKPDEMNSILVSSGRPLCTFDSCDDAISPGPRRRCRSRCDHVSAGADTFRTPELGPCLFKRVLSVRSISVRQLI